MVCCWGRIRRPLGAALSMGTTRITRSPGWSRSAMRRRPLLSGFRCAMRSLRASIPRFVRAETHTARSARDSGRGQSPSSHLFQTTRQGISMPRMRSSRARSASARPSAASTTSRAMSVRRSSSSALSMRFWPSSPSSSRPGVSTSTTGPRGSSSIAFLTGSVVVPLVSETTARSWPVRALMRLDLPALRRPKMPMRVRFAEGVAFKLMGFSLLHFVHSAG